MLDLEETFMRVELAVKKAIELSSCNNSSEVFCSAFFSFCSSQILLQFVMNLPPKKFYKLKSDLAIFIALCPLRSEWKLTNSVCL